jgi:hypothetical protein
MVSNASQESFTGDRPTTTKTSSSTTPSTTITTITVNALEAPGSTAIAAKGSQIQASKGPEERHQQQHGISAAFSLHAPTAAIKASTSITATTIPAIITTTNLTSTTTTLLDTSPPTAESLAPAVPVDGQLESSLSEPEFVVPTLASTASGTISTSGLSSTETTPSRRRIAPVTIASRRIAYPATRLSLQMPTRGAANLMLEPAIGYSNVARRPRLDFTRAC